ncbi:MAG: MBL fold metallo-hydrolase [Coriobacteriales bacterium]|jgi:phosphoribosyl 1,2-cyclic phosphodiesterase|nr:MBL fold metallo-hydrolase [Coriobacteriales bacterium]
MPKIHVLASGSAGNCTLIETTAATLMVDCGTNLKTLRERAAAVGANLAKLKAILITHEHIDHLGGLGKALRYLSKQGIYPDIFVDVVTQAACAGRYFSDDKTVYHLRRFRVGECFGIDGFPGLEVQSFATSHDVANPCGFVFDFTNAPESPTSDAGAGQNSCRIGYCTDTGLITAAARAALDGCDALLLEANHDPEMLRTGSYAPPLKERVGGEHGHLSNEQFGVALQELAGPRLQAVCAMHLSHENNLPHLVADILDGLFADSSAATYVASQSQPVSFSV